MSIRLLVCHACGAVVPPLGDTHAQCAFCLARIAIPYEFRRPMAAMSELQHHYAASLVALATAEANRGFQLIFSMIFGATILFTGLASFVGMVLVTPANALGAFAGTAGLPTLIAVCIGSGVRQHRKREARSLAALPFVIVDERDLTARCPRCGAGVAPRAGDVATTCAHCGTRGLLPRSMVEHGQRALHQRVVAARMRGEATATSATHLTHAINAGVGDAFLLAGLAALIGFTAYAFVEPLPVYPQPHRHAMRFVCGLVTGGFMSAFGGLMLHDAQHRQATAHRQVSPSTGSPASDPTFQRHWMRWVGALVIGLLVSFGATLAGEFSGPNGWSLNQRDAGTDKGGQATFAPAATATDALLGPMREPARGPEPVALAVTRPQSVALPASPVSTARPSAGAKTNGRSVVH